ncbi:hypothetical protein [Streptomyces minutiscleroticus]|uniref:Lipoprotein n=1 Tax=Streptomyces minutiscleroticus TaxID=68238 RepID=A0A918U3T3_9ACTN|nr:hypothetical protein [Streptomyces minutiscleroticus]GGX86783.1 hypothetical protein GCM10010358_46040 [Streptomyces minutiscleroticus]
MSRSGGSGRGAVGRVARTAAAVVVIGVIGGCSSPHAPGRSDERERSYCTGLGAWQDARRAADGSAEAAGDAALAAAKVLDREGLDHDGSHVLRDTAAAVGGDAGAESRVVSYCDATGFETLVG